jgi:sugar O-acyltransferase (sialic acid O-acetyltransferase NeuD family)
MVKKVIIVGAGDSGLELASIISKDINNQIEILGFIDDDTNKIGKVFNGHRVLSSIKDYRNVNNSYLLSSITETIARKKTIDYLEKNNNFTSYIHSTAVINSNLSNSIGLIVYPFSVISNNVKISKHVFINLHSTIGHDAEIGTYSVISSHCDITGHVKIGQSNFVGSHSTFVPKVKTGNNVRVGIGSIVVSNIQDNTNVFGNPARKY